MNKTYNTMKVRTAKRKAKQYKECLVMAAHVMNNRCKQIYKRLTVNDIDWNKDAELLNYRDKLVQLLSDTGCFDVKEVCCDTRPVCDELVYRDSLFGELYEIYAELVEIQCIVDVALTPKRLDIDNEIEQIYKLIALFQDKTSENMCMELGEPIDFEEVHPASFEFGQCYIVGDEVIKTLLTNDYDDMDVITKNETYIEILLDGGLIAVVDATDNSIYTDYPIDAF